MKVDLAIIQELLSGVPVPITKIEGEFMLSIYNSIQSLFSGKCNGKMDVAILLRNALRYYDCQRDPKKSFAVVRSPKSHHLPSRNEWLKCGFLILKEDEHVYHLQANPWQPIWLIDSSDIAPAGASFAQENRRKYKSVPADPFLFKNTPYIAYNNSAQRDAIRAVLTMPKGSTLAISIPTGSGKSLCAWLPAILKDGLIVVVVPTVALALDQEQALSGHFPYSLAYHGGDDSTSVEKRKGIRERICANEQRIVFTSPESIKTSLFDILGSAAALKHLSHFIIDEAHIVYEWGNEFRSAFQRIAGVRRALLRYSELTLKTVMLSATLTPNTLSLLKGIFGEPGPFQVYASIQLREEPSYWFVKCSETEKELHILEAINHLPRPLVVYTTKVNDAQKLFQRIKAEGYIRAGLLTGLTSTEDRNNLISAWKGGAIDIVFGTAAFGLGIDKSNVRSVVHTCVPESVDRYYQELGRGGRDGNACMSLVIYTAQDEQDALRFSREKVLTIENGWERWCKLFSNKKTLGGRKYKLDLTDKRHIGLEDGDYNEGWNLKTLLLMAQAGLIALDEEDRRLTFQTDTITNEKTTVFQKAKREAYQVIEILDLDHFSEDYWKGKVELVRNSIKEESWKGVSTMVQLLKGEKCIGSILKDFYCNNDVAVTKACGGCPYCRINKHPVYSGLLPTRKFIWKYYDFQLQGDLQKELTRTSQLIVFYTSEERNSKNWEVLVDQLILWLARRGVVAFIANQSVLQRIRKCLFGEKEIVLLYSLEENFFVPPVPSIFISLSDADKIPSECLRFREGVPKLLLLPFNIKQPGAPNRLLRDMVGAPTQIIYFSDLIKKYGIV